MMLKNFSWYHNFMAKLDEEEFKLTPTEHLVLESLTARYRLGENSWTFVATANKALISLEEKGLVNWKSSSIENHSLVWFTNKGKALMLARKYTPVTGWKKLKKVNKALRKEAKKLKKKLEQD